MLYIKFGVRQKGGVMSLTHEDLQKIGDTLELRIGLIFDKKFDAAFDRKFDAAFDRKFDEAFDRKFDAAFDRKFLPAFNEAFNKIFPLAIEKFWQDVMLPAFRQEFVTKEDLDGQFQAQSIHIAEEFQVVRGEIFNVDSKLTSLTKRVEGVDKHLVALQKSHLQYVEATKQKFLSHTDHFRKIYGVAEPEKPKYGIE